MGAACIWVVLSHNVCVWPGKLWIFEQFAYRGNAGVDIFLLLSGIGLYYSYSKYTDSISTAARLKQYYPRRMVRLLVPYVLLGLPYYIWVSYGAGFKEFCFNFFQINLFLKQTVTSWYVVAAFLFYLVFPVIYFFQQNTFFIAGQRVERNTVTLALCLAAFTLNVIAGYLFPGIWTHSEIALTRSVVFIIGCGLGKEVKEHKQISQTAFCSCIAIIILYIYLFCPHVALDHIWYRMSIIPLGLASAIVLGECFHKMDGCTKIRKAFRFFGDRSLEIYLTHVFVINVWLHYLGSYRLDEREFVGYACMVIIAVLISTAVHPLVVKISNRLLGALTAAKQPAR